MTETIGQPETCGLLYICYGKKYVQAAMESARSAARHNPDLAMHLFVDGYCYRQFGFAANPAPFSSVGIIENPHRRSKVDHISRSPFGRTLYLDSDTRVVADIRGLFGVLDRFDIAAVQAMHRNGNRRTEKYRIDIPAPFPQFNGGVILFRKTEGVTRLLQDWSVAFAEMDTRHDQASLRELLWLSDLRVYTLPPEYNVRYKKYLWLWSKSEAVPQILHSKDYHRGSHWTFVIQPLTVFLKLFGVRWGTLARRLGYQKKRTVKK